jgi:putative Mg2+ transporter-C (MgtC) family protein
MSRVIQGLATGIGFLGAGTILKLGDKREIRGLTTSASIWITAGISVAIGLGQIAIALLGTLLAWIVLSLMVKVENYINRATDGESADR